MERVKSDFELLAEHLAVVRPRFVQCLEEAQTGDADRLARAVATHLAGTTAADLPEPAQLVWHERIARPLKADGAKPLTERAIAGMRSWPAARVEQLLAALVEIEGHLREAEIDARNEIILAEIAREYS